MNYFSFYNQRKRTSKLIWFAATILTFLFYFFFFYMFTIKKNPAVGNISFYRKITVLNLNSKNIDKHKDMLPWLEFGNPVLIAKPSEEYGYSSLIRKRSFRPPDESIRKSNKSFITFETTKPAFHFIPIASPEEYGKTWGYSSLSIPTLINSVKTVEKKSFPLWKNLKGDIYPQIFDDLKSLHLKIKKFKPLKSTELEAYYHGSGFVPNVKIKRTCGNEELDRLAKLAFLKKYRKLNLKLDEYNPVKYIIIEWEGSNNP